MRSQAFDPSLHEFPHLSGDQGMPPIRPAMDPLHLAAELIEELLVASGVHDGILLSLNHQNTGIGGPSRREGSTCFQQDQVVIEALPSL